MYRFNPAEPTDSILKFLAYSTLNLKKKELKDLPEDFNPNLLNYFIIGLFTYHSFIVTFYVMCDPTSIKIGTLSAAFVYKFQVCIHLMTKRVVPIKQSCAD
jgi:hypothetical protein